MKHIWSSRNSTYIYLSLYLQALKFKGLENDVHAVTVPLQNPLFPLGREKWIIRWDYPGLEKHSGKGMATAFARGAQTMNTMVFKPVGRKAFHKKSTSADMIRETRKFEGEEMKNKSHMGMGSENDGNISWVPHERTGIYYPKGQEKVMDDITAAAARDMGVNWFT